MKLACCLFHYFPYGGLQRDFMRIAKASLERGHEVHVYTTRWEGESIPGLKVHIVHITGMQNHTRNRSFANAIAALSLSTQYDCVIGFNPMPGLDYYFAADVCYQANMRESRSCWYRLLPRYRQKVALEQAVFQRGLKTHIWLLTQREQERFQQYYHTESSRFHLLPPGMTRRSESEAEIAVLRDQFRHAKKVKPDQIICLMVASRFHTKGVDRSIEAIAALPKPLRENIQLWIVGDDHQKPYLSLAAHFDLQNQVTFWGAQQNVIEWMWASDYLLHPARVESAGMVLLEAIIAGLPILTVAACGYAHYVKAANAGLVLEDPYRPSSWNDMVKQCLFDAKRSEKSREWRESARAYANSADWYGMTDAAIILIESFHRNK